MRHILFGMRHCTSYLCPINNIKVHKMTHTDKINAELQILKPNLVRGDMKACAEAVGTTKENVSRYMRGQVRHTDTGILILNFFRNLIDQREKQLA